MTGFRRGTRLGVDVGTVRVGVARCDPDGMLATPVETVSREAESITSAVDRVLALAHEHSVIEILVGLPLALSGNETASTRDATAFAAAVAARASVPVRLVDERLSTVSANAELRRAGRSQRSSRKVVDQVAAVILLQSAIDVEKRSGSAPGTPVKPA